MGGGTVHGDELAEREQAVMLFNSREIKKELSAVGATNNLRGLAENTKFNRQKHPSQ